MEETTLSIELPKKLSNPNYNPREIEVNGEKRIIAWGQPEFYSLEDKNWELLEEGFRSIEELAFSDNQLKSINDFLIDKYYRLCKMRLYEGGNYGKWMVYKRNDDILFSIYEVWGADMTREQLSYLFPFLGGEMELSETISFWPEKFGFEYQFSIYNEKEEEES